MSTGITEYLNKITNGTDLCEDDARTLFNEIMSGDATPVQIAALLSSLRTKGETIDEITGAAKTLRTKAKKFPIEQSLLERAVDTCGTGGDGKHTLNISTATAFVIAGCGVPVIKHGNKAVSSKSGSADVLKTLGVNIDMDEATALRCVSEANICFLMAPNYHSAMKYVAPVRQELKIRTIFNILGPLINPAGVKCQVIGVFAKEWVEPLANVLQNLGSTHAWVVHGMDGMDEITTTDKTFVAEIKDGNIRTFTISPESLGIKLVTEDDLRGGNAEQNAAAIRALLSGKKGAYADIVHLNAAAGLVVAGAATSLEDGMEKAEQAINDGAAMDALEKLVSVSNS